MRISIAMPVRNGERYVQELLESLLGQTHPPHELVVVDDASTDATPALLEAFADAAPFPVRITRFDERRGHVEGVMWAASRCTGDAIAFCDADDVWHPRKLEVCGRELEESGAWLVLHTTKLVDADLSPLDADWPANGRTRTVPPLGLAGLEIQAPAMAMVFPRALLDAADFSDRPPSRYGHGRLMLNDEWVLVVAGALGSVRVLEDRLVLYRRHGANDSLGPGTARRRATLRPVLEDYRAAAEHTSACAQYLERTRPADPALADRVAAAAREYRRMAEGWSLRTGLYTAAGWRERARLLGALVRAGAYRSRTEGGFGRAAFGKDVVSGLLLRLREGQREAVSASPGG